MMLVKIITLFFRDNMKKLILGMIIGFSFSALVGAGIAEYVVSNKTAEVERYQNLYVFTDCKPVKEYDYLGTVKVRLSVGERYTEFRDILIKNAYKKYPNADGIIITGDKADVIKFR